MGRARLPLIAICLLSFPAYAQYSGGSGTADDPYQIATAADLIALGETPDDYDKHFILTADIDLDPDLPGRKVFRTAVIAPGKRAYNLEEDESYFAGDPFTGTFDGNGHTISRLTIFGAEHLGLFGQLGSGALLMDVRMVNVTVTGTRSHIGALAGGSGSWPTRGGMVRRCHSTGAVSGGEFLGGLVGENRGILIQCYSRCAVDGDENVGGLVGENSNGRIAQCWASGTVAGSEDVGGLVGENWEGQVAQCYSMGAVDGDKQAGGLVGSNRGVVTGCYSTGAVWSDGGDEIGGLVGSSRGAVVARSFWDTATSNRFWSDGGTGLPTVQMQKARTFLDAGWDFVGETENGTEDIWWILEGQDYPRLWWELPTEYVVLVVDNFESYNNDSPYRVFQTWIDGPGFSAGPLPGYRHPGNGTGSWVGHDVWGPNIPFIDLPIMETQIVHDGWQSMPLYYDNDGTLGEGTRYERSGVLFCSEAGRTFTTPSYWTPDGVATPRDWTIDDADTLTLHFRGEADNDAEPLYVGIEDAAGQIAVVTHPDADAVLATEWQKWHIPLAELQAAGVDVALVRRMTIGIGDCDDPEPGGEGLIYIDDILVTNRMP